MYQEKGSVFSGMFKKSPKLSEAPRLEEVKHLHAWLLQSNSKNEMVYQNHRSSIAFIHHVIKLSTLCLITGFTSACSCSNRVCDSLCSGCTVVAQGALCQLGQPVGEQGEPS